MTNEESIVNELTEKFSFLSGKSRIARERRIFMDVPNENFIEVFTYVTNKMSFPNLCTITGVDEGDNLRAIYHIAKDNGIILSLSAYAPKTNPVFKTVTNFFPSAEMYERELEDMFGAKVDGLKPGRRYPLPESWPVNDHPLRKDWKATQN